MIPPLVTLTSDFGTSDAYVASMKAAILKQCPLARLIDITHHIPPQDILCGSITLERAVDGFPPATIHLAVVDPGVGTKRRLLIVKIQNQFVVCPDNGLITWPWRRLGPGTAHELTWRPRQFSRTFHGRDILAPAAGMLAAGTPMANLTRPIRNPILLDIAPAKSPLKSGTIIHIDHFGNATTNIQYDLLRANRAKRIRLNQLRIERLRKTYSDVPPGNPVALIGSSGLLEIAVRDGSAAKTLGVRVGDQIIIE